VTTVGSWPRPSELLRAHRRKQRGELSSEEFNKLADAAVLDILRLQEQAGIDIVTDGEQRRDNFYSFVAEKLQGVQLMSLAEMLDIVEDKAGFERILQTLDVPAYSIKNPTCTGKIARRQSLAVDDYLFLRQHTDHRIKVPLPGPYLLTRAMWVKEATRAAYESKEELAEDVVGILSEELQELSKAGADFVQLDEPVLTELVFTQGQTRTFMCAALAARKDPAEELEFAVSLINRVAKSAGNIRTGLHICRGNWSQQETTLLKGSYQPLLPYLERVEVDQFVLEFATPRAGELGALLQSEEIRKNKELGLGVINPRTPAVETAASIVTRVDEALGYLPAERVFLNPDCGFGTFSSRPMNSAEIAKQKLEAMTEAASILRQRHSN
jgi:5-methyltetrahydropteroyltriglutamate--homocysteine methyltransferase